MVNFTYTYLLMGILLLVVWLILFFWRKDLRKDMLSVSILFAIVGPLVSIIYTIDWWSPLTITGTAIGIEDVLFGFVCGGVTATIYETVFRKKLSRKKKNHKKLNGMPTAIIVLTIFFGSFFILKINSFFSSIITLVAVTLLIWFKRRDLIKNSLFSGVLLVVVIGGIYSILELITPGWIQSFWHFKNVPEIIIFNIPIDDIVWYFLVGTAIGPLYEYWQNKRMVNKK